MLFKEMPLSAAVGSLVGKSFPADRLDALLGNGKFYASADSSAQQCQFDLLPNVSVVLAIIVGSRSTAVVSDVVRVSSVEKCEIDRAETRIDGAQLKIVLQNNPKYLDRIHYIVAQKTSSRVPWATVDDAEQGRLCTITAKDYRRDGMILVESPPKTDLYISVIGQYKMPDGSMVCSEPSKQRISNRPKQKIRYYMTWAEGLFTSRRKPKDCKLYVFTDAEETPTLRLVYCTDGHIPMSLTDPKAAVLYTIPESDTGFPSGQYIYSFPDATWERVKAQTQLRLLLSYEDMMEYELEPEDVASLQVPQK